jgi:hypothetical protein
VNILVYLYTLRAPQIQSTVLLVTLVVRTRQMTPWISSFVAPAKAGVQGAPGRVHVAPCSSQGQALGARFRGHDAKNAWGQMSDLHH